MEDPSELTKLSPRVVEEEEAAEEDSVST